LFAIDLSIDLDYLI